MPALAASRKRSVVRPAGIVKLEKMRSGIGISDGAPPLMTLSLRHLRYFIAAAESGQVSRAAVELSVSQSTITAAIQHL
jgi:hypothetical protein